MSDTYVITTHCDEEGCTASYQREGLAAPKPEGWQYVPRRSMKVYYTGTKAKDYCPAHRKS